MSRTTLAPEASYETELSAAPADVTYLTTLFVNVVMIGTPNPLATMSDWVLVDAGIPFHAARVAAFARRRFGANPPRAILLTHGHFDHVGSLRALLRRWPQTPVYAHLLELPYLTGRSAYPPPDPTVGGGLMTRTCPLFPHRAYNFRPNVMPLPADGVVPFLPEWRWIHTPGHSPGHVCYFRESDRTLIAGDAFITQKQESLIGALTRATVVHGPPTYFTPDWISARSSIETIESLQPRYAITGHGLPIANPQLVHHLHLLATRFDRIAMPADGRYVRQPAWSDESGTVWVPPPVPDPVPKVLAAVAVAAAGFAIARAYMKRTRA